MMLGLSGALVQYSPDIREMPDYCMSTSLDPRSWFRGLLEACAPYAQDELEAMTRSQAVAACRNSTDPAACEEDMIARAAAAQRAAESTDPSGTCEYNASQDHPSLSRLMGTAAVCKLYSGSYTPYIIGAAVVAAVLLFAYRGRR
jgi:hypothetical protein